MRLVGRMTLTIRGCWYANGSQRAADRSALILREDMKQNLAREIQLINRLSISKREARLIQSQHFKQTGEIA